MPTIGYKLQIFVLLIKFYFFFLLASEKKEIKRSVHFL